MIMKITTGWLLWSIFESLKTSKYTSTPNRNSANIFSICAIRSSLKYRTFCKEKWIKMSLLKKRHILLHWFCNNTVQKGFLGRSSHIAHIVPVFHESASGILVWFSKVKKFPLESKVAVIILFMEDTRLIEGEL